MDSAAGVERHAHPGEDTVHVGGRAVGLAFTSIVLGQDGAGVMDDLRHEAHIRGEGQVLAGGEAVVILHHEAIVEIIVVIVVERDVEMGGGDDLRDLGVDKLQHIVEGECDVYALRDACEGIHLLHTALQVGNGLHTLNGDGSLIGKVLEEDEIARGIGLARETRTERQPADGLIAAAQADEEPRARGAEARDCSGWRAGGMEAPSR